MKSIILKRVEEALQESENLTQSILDGAFDAIISMDVKGKIVQWNKRAEAMFGWEASQVTGKILSEIIIPPRYRKSHTNALERFLSRNETEVLNQQLEICALHRDGFEIPVEITISATGWAGSFIFTGIVRDISSRKKAEEQVRQKNEEYEVMHEIAKGLHNSETMNTMLEEALNVITHSKAFNFERTAGIFLTEENKEEFYLASSTGKISEKISEIDKDSFLKKGFWLKELDSQNGAISNCCLINSGNDGNTKVFENKGLYIVPLNGHKGLIGFLILFSSEATPSYERSREILFSIGGLIADAIQHFRCNEKTKKQNEELAAANNKLKELNVLKNKFLGMASHDLRNPLYLIESYSEFLLNDLSGKVNHHQHNLLEKIFTSSEFMRNLLDNLLDISKIESGKYDLIKKEEDLNALVKNQVELHNIIAKKKNIKISLNLGEIPSVHCDKNAVIQIMGNFIGNAIKFSPANSKIEVSTASEGEGVRFFVKDEGPGICSKEQKLLFGEFQTLSPKPTGGEKSTGLGLAIVKKLVNLHGGKVGVSCKPGKGSTFYFTLSTNGV